MRFLIRLAVTAAALWAAVALVPGIEHRGPWTSLLIVALVFGLVNAVVRPIIYFLTCPLVVLTLGLFVFVLNGLMLWITGAISDGLGLGFTVDGFVPAILGALVVGLVSMILNIFVGEKEPEE